MTDQTPEQIVPSDGESPRKALTYHQVRAIERMSKARLVAEVRGWGRIVGSTWLVGGPNTWSRSELVNAVVRIREGRGL